MDVRFHLDSVSGYSRVVVGVSGGTDSLCLLHLACLEPRLKIIAAHFDHQLRPGSDREAEAVCRLVKDLNVEFVAGCADVRTHASQNHLSLEEAARLLRYHFLFSTARKEKADCVAVGHTADDQVETIVMHFLRGAGLEGLKGMSAITTLAEFDHTIPLVRPILHLWRHQTEAYCQEHRLMPVEDPSNRDHVYLRNRLRHQLIPQLATYNPEFKTVLLRTAEALSGDHQILSGVIQSAWAQVVCGQAENFITFDEHRLNNFPAALRRSLFRRGMQFLRPAIRNLDFNTLDRAARFVESPSQRVVDLTEGLHLFREAGVIHLAAMPTDLPTGHWPLIRQPVILKVGGQADLNPGFTIKTELCDIFAVKERILKNRDPFTAWLDAASCGDQFTVRSRRPGDGFSPLGMGSQQVSLQDFYINVKLPSRARGSWPLVCVGDKIAWVPGYRLDHSFRTTGQTRQVVKLTVRKKRKSSRS